MGTLSNSGNDECIPLAIRHANRMNPSGLPESVSQCYYKHGLFISSYPTCATTIAIVAIFFSCYPLLNIPLPGTIPTKIIIPLDVNTKNVSSEGTLLWAKNSPMFFVQQISMRASVLPWTENTQLMDAFRAPLQEVFKLLKIIREHKTKDGNKTLYKLCLHVEKLKISEEEDIFPENDCLVLSPANLWGQSVKNFSKDHNILNTIFKYHNLQKTKISTAELVFGIPIEDTGLKRYPLRSRSRIIQYAITLVLKDNDIEYLESLKRKLFRIYPISQYKRTQQREKSSIMLVFYPGELKIWEFLPISIALLLLFVYVYFSVWKITVIRSRIALASLSVITVLGSLMMSLGICFFFGLTISLQSKDIFPYLVVLVGLENCLVITKSVVSTDETLDVKIRVAQALSKEGWHITKTLLTEITILTIGLVTFVPVIQEFCVFAIVGLFSDFLLQMLLFSTVLAMNIKRTEYSMEAKHLPKIIHGFTSDVNSKKKRSEEFTYFSNFESPNEINSPCSQPHSKYSDIEKRERLSVVMKSKCNEQRIPKRLKIVNFWARTRFFQRAFMVWMSVWICSIVYNSGYVENLFTLYMNDSNFRTKLSHDTNFWKGNTEDFMYYAPEHEMNPTKNKEINASLTFLLPDIKNSHHRNNSEQIKKLQNLDFDLNHFLSSFHWSTIMEHYNISLSGRYVTILPTIKLLAAIEVDLATHVRNSDKNLLQNFQWKTLAAALDPLDFNDENRKFPIITPCGKPLFPKSPMEIFLTIILCSISVFVLCYTMIVLYRCICTRNYAEWRSSWNQLEPLAKTEKILEGAPMQIVGHKHTIECLASDGVNIVSSCLEGKIRVWDVRSGEIITKINRNDGQLTTNTNGCENVNKTSKNSPVWCLDFFDSLIAVGCANGRIEIWETPTGILKCSYHEESTYGVTHIYINADRIIVARLCGRLEFYRLKTYFKGKQIDWGFTSAYRRTHFRTESTGNIHSFQHETEYNRQFSSDIRNNINKEEIRCYLDSIRFGHQQPITCMEVANGIVFTGSQDHILKVYSLDNTDLEYTLHGHCGPITCLFIDRWQSGTGGSGSQDGMLCVWDLLTGACMYNIQAHSAEVCSLACAPSYVISLGADERIRVWERFQGNLLNTIIVSNAYSNLLMLSPSLLVTSKTGSIIVWDVRTGEPAREVKLDCSNSQLCSKYIILTCNAVVCDYGNEIRVVRFPIMADKYN